jgi:FkbM family methyltransferase
MSRIEIGAGDLRRASWFGLKPVAARLLGARSVNPLVRLAARSVLPSAIGHRLPLNVPSVTYRLEDGGTIALLDPLHDVIARDIHWGEGKPLGAAERIKLAWLERLSKNADLFIDIGAYAGICSLIAARSNPRLKAVAYEIVPENYLLLVRNIVQNDLVGRIDARLRGLGEAASAIKLPAGFGGASYMSSISLGSDFATGVSIPVVPLDEDLGLDAARLLIKIDVEGFEYQVLRGARGLVEKCRPDIICEVLPGTEESAKRISEMLVPLGYRWFCFEDDGPEARDRLEPRTAMRDWLFTCRPDAVSSYP